MRQNQYYRNIIDSYYSSGKLVGFIDEVGRGCERPDAEILTYNGWKYYRDIDLTDKVLSYNNAGHICWQKINRVIEYNFNGRLIELKNRGIHIVVTPEHNFPILHRTFKRDTDCILKMTGHKFIGNKNVNMLGTNDSIPRGGKWAGTGIKYFKLPKLKNIDSPLKIPIDLWVAFLGIFLSEGCTTFAGNGNYRVIISQKPGYKSKRIWILLNKLPFNFKKRKMGFETCNKRLYAYLKQFGKARHKFIPKDIKNLPIPLLTTLLNWLLLGDGNIYQHTETRQPLMTYYTTSNILKDDIEEVLLKLGYSYNTTLDKKAGTLGGFIRGRLITAAHDCYRILIRRNIHCYTKFLNKKLIPYIGKVFCLELPEYHNFFVRRSGTGYFTGNSLAGDLYTCCVVFKDNKFFDCTINDSKKINKAVMGTLANLIKLNALEVTLGVVTTDEINTTRNINTSTFLAMERAVSALQNKPDVLFIDGIYKINVPIEQVTVIKGDSKIFGIACASIVAKNARDAYMKTLDAAEPFYGWSTNAGYGSQKHKDGIKSHGLSIHHRTYFKGVI